MDQLKSDFVSMVAHEVRSPLNTVLMQLKVIQDGLVGPVADTQQDMLGRISERVKSLVDLSSELLDLAKIESGLVTQEKKKLDMGGLLKDQAAFHQHQAKECGITLTLKPFTLLPPVLGNRRNMEEVLSNLLTNAIKYNRKGGKITLAAEVENGYFLISVTDTGIGIAEEDLPYIFDRFYRVKDDRTRLVSGTGLGLAIVKSIVEAHNGTITVESKCNKGSTFKVYIPLMSP
jgi:signal transduction histidine kinase